MRRGRINSEGRKLVGGLWGGNLKIYRGRGSSRRCIWGEKMQLEWDLDTVQCEQKSTHIHRCEYIKPKYTKYFKINWRGCIWGEKMQLGWDLGNCGARGRDWCTMSKSIFAVPSFMLYYISKLDWWTFSKNISTALCFIHFSSLRPLPLCYVSQYFKTRLVHCVKKCTFFTLPSFLFTRQGCALNISALIVGADVFGAYLVVISKYHQQNWETGSRSARSLHQGDEALKCELLNTNQTWSYYHH